MINSEWVRAFVCFAETMNFTRAAARLHLSQPALHVQIRKLGEALGSALYVRTGRTLTLTDAGRTLLAFGRQQQERIDQLIEDITGAQQRHRVVLAAGEGTFLYLLGPALRAFQHGKHGQLQVLTRDREQALTALQVGEAHWAVTVADEVPDHIVARRLLRAGTAVVMPKGHPLARKRALKLLDLRQQPLIAPALGRPLRAALARAWSELGTPWTPAVEANGWELMMRFAALGMGLAVVNDFCTPPPGTVKRPLLGLPTLQYQLLRLRSRTPSPAMAALETAIVSSLAL